jgi:hypothetical protein
MVGSLVGCCACAVSGHTAALPRSVMNSRRFTADASLLSIERIARLGYGRRRLLRCGISIKPMSEMGHSRPIDTVTAVAACPLHLQ